MKDAASPDAPSQTRPTVQMHEHAADPFFIVQHCAIVRPQVLQSCLEKSVQAAFYGNIYNAARLLTELHSSSYVVYSLPA